LWGLKLKVQLREGLSSGECINIPALCRNIRAVYLELMSSFIYRERELQVELTSFEAEKLK